MPAIYAADGNLSGRRAATGTSTIASGWKKRSRETSRRPRRDHRFPPGPRRWWFDSQRHSRCMEPFLWRLMSGIPVSNCDSAKGVCHYTELAAGQDGPILIDYILRRDFEGLRRGISQVYYEGNTAKTERNITRVGWHPGSPCGSARPAHRRERGDYRCDRIPEGRDGSEENTACAAGIKSLSQLHYQHPGRSPLHQGSRPPVRHSQ